MMRCRICGEEILDIFTIKNRSYSCCHSCGSICTCPESFDSAERQRTRYEQHHNSLSDEGYRSFLEDFIMPVLKETERQIQKDRNVKENDKGCHSLGKILDYGSGPEPALCQLMSGYAHEGVFLPNDCEIRGWDPFFAPETAFFEEGADLVTCLEVAEHFETPLLDMKKLSSALRTGGYAAIGTMLLHSGQGTLKEKVRYEEGADYEAFKNWWYRSDSTHVAFYTLEGLTRCAGNAGLEFIKAVTDRAFLFRKTV